jgi:hypothetical protein
LVVRVVRFKVRAVQSSARVVIVLNDGSMVFAGFSRD